MIDVCPRCKGAGAIVHNPYQPPKKLGELGVYGTFEEAQHASKDVPIIKVTGHDLKAVHITCNDMFALLNINIALVQPDTGWHTGYILASELLPAK